MTYSELIAIIEKAMKNGKIEQTEKVNFDKIGIKLYTMKMDKDGWPEYVRVGVDKMKKKEED